MWERRRRSWVPLYKNEILRISGCLTGSARGKIKEIDKMTERWGIDEIRI